MLFIKASVLIAASSLASAAAVGSSAPASASASASGLVSGDSVTEPTDETLTSTLLHTVRLGRFSSPTGPIFCGEF